MKIGIYSICKNEEENFAGWWNSVKDADEIFVLDTGSTDKTLDLLQEKFAETFVVKKNFRYNYYGDRPFEFDVARNCALDGLMWGSQVPVDYAVWVDFDETFPDGWIDQLRKTLTACIEQGVPLPNSMQFTNRFEGSETSWYQTRGHIPRDYMWKYSAHEVLMPKDHVNDEAIGRCDVEITHPNKDIRNDYTDLLIRSHEKYADGRTSYYLGREFYYNRDWENASRYLRECLFVHNGWQAERGEAAKMLSRLHDDDPVFAVKYLHFYLAYCNLQREPYLELARYYHDREEWSSVIHYVLKALEITERPDSYLVLDDSCYGAMPHDYAMIAYDRLGDRDNAAYHAALCLNYEPNNQRYRENVQYFINEGVLRVENHSETADA